MKLDKTIIILIGSLLHTAVYTQDIFDEFKKKVHNEYVKPFNRDLTGVICSNIFNHAGKLGLFSAVPPSVGVNIKISGSAKKISNDNVIIKDTFKDFGYLPFVAVQLEKGLPYNIDLVVRYSGYGSFTFWSAGVKYKIISLPPKLSILNFAIAGVYNKLVAKDILEHISQSYSLIISADVLPIVKPYVVLGMDVAEMKVDEKLLGGMIDKFSSDSRYEVGFNISPFPFFYLTVVYCYIYNTEGLALNLGVKF